MVHTEKSVNQLLTAGQPVKFNLYMAVLLSQCCRFIIRILAQAKGVWQPEHVQ